MAWCEPGARCERTGAIARCVAGGFTATVREAREALDHPCDQKIRELTTPFRVTLLGREVTVALRDTGRFEMTGLPVPVGTFGGPFTSWDGGECRRVLGTAPDRRFVTSRAEGLTSDIWEVALYERDGAIEIRYDLSAPRWVYPMIILADGGYYRAPAVRAARGTIVRLTPQ